MPRFELMRMPLLNEHNKMTVLLSNDDGVHAAGLTTLRQVLIEKGIHTLVAAPDRDRSGASNSLTLDRPLHPVKVDDDAYGINGTPTDAVHLGLNTLFVDGPERVIAGINAGANLGDDVIYSGTVAAAMEGRFLDKAPIAISLVGHKHFLAAAQILVNMLSRLDNLDLTPGTLLNINVPDVPENEIKGFQITRLGHRSRSDNPVHMQNPRGKSCYWIAKAGEGADCGPGTDFHAINQGYVSITPVSVDMTAHGSLSTLEDWLNDKG